MNVRVLALDLERTLIDDSLNALPRPGLRAFLMFCQEHFERVALFTTVEEADAREVMGHLDRAGELPAGFLTRLEYVTWSGEYKNLGLIPRASAGEILLVDDDAGWVHPGQRAHWIPVAPWDGGPDDELARVRSELEARLGGGSQTKEL